METIEVAKLKPHPRNDYFFDDIQGDNWTEFKKSIESSGVIEPIVISQDCMIISGHQRVRACKELNIKEIPCRIKIYDSEDAEDIILKELLETNLRQRGIGNLNPIKFARCIAELERIYGIRNGSAGGNGSNQYNKTKHDKDNLGEAKNQKKLSEELNISDQQLRDYKKLLTLVPELQDLIETGEMSSTVGYKVWAKLSHENQALLVEELGADVISNMTQKQTQEYIDRIKCLENQVKGYQMKLETRQENNIKSDNGEIINELMEEKNKLETERRKEYERAEQLKKEIEAKEKEVERLKNQEPKKVIPDDYHKVKEDKQKLEKKVEKIEADLQAERQKIKEITPIKNDLPVLNYDYFNQTSDTYLQYINMYAYKDIEFSQLSPIETQQYLDTMAKVEEYFQKIKNILINSEQERKVS